MSIDDLWNVLVLAVIIVGVVVTVRGNRTRTRIFKECADRLGIEGFQETASSITGKVRGLPLDVRFHSGGKNSPPSTTIEVGCTPCAIFLELRRQNEEEVRAVHAGEAVDVTLGDAAFDAAWIVEGAPASRVRRLLQDPSLRARLLAFASLTDAKVTIDKGKVTVKKRDSEIGPGAVATERIELALALAAAVIADAETPLDPGEIDPARAGYRTAGVTDADAEGAAAIARLKGLRAARTINQLRMVIPFGAFAMSAMLVGVSSTGPGAWVPAIPILIFSLIVSLVLGGLYRAQLREAPGLPVDKVIVWTLVAWWGLDLAIFARVYLRG